MLQLHATFASPVSAGPLRSGLPRMRSRTAVNKARSIIVHAELPAKEKITEALEYIDENVLDYCSLDQKGGRPKSRLSIGEKEQEFLSALRSFYYDKEPAMSNEEFDNLKEELMWEGSKVVILSPTEQRFLEASLSYAAGKPIMSDEEFDQLKRELKKSNSAVTVQGPRCSIRSRTLYADASPDYIKMTLLNLPAALVTLGVLFLADDLSGFGITGLIELPEPFGIIFLWCLVLPSVFIIVNQLTNLVLRDALILKADCPNCGATNSSYFGDILVVQGSRQVNTLACQNCKSQLEFNADKRLVKVLAGPPPPKPKKGAKAAAS